MTGIELSFVYILILSIIESMIILHDVNEIQKIKKEIKYYERKENNKAN